MYVTPANQFPGRGGSMCNTIYCHSRFASSTHVGAIRYTMIDSRWKQRLTRAPTSPKRLKTRKMTSPNHSFISTQPLTPKIPFRRKKATASEPNRTKTTRKNEQASPPTARRAAPRLLLPTTATARHPSPLTAYVTKHP